MKDKKYIYYAILFFVFQIIAYIGSYLGKKSWKLVFEVAFSNLGYAIGFNFLLIIAIYCFIKYLKENNE